MSKASSLLLILAVVALSGSVSAQTHLVSPSSPSCLNAGQPTMDDTHVYWILSDGSLIKHEISTGIQSRVDFTIEPCGSPAADGGRVVYRRGWDVGFYARIVVDGFLELTNEATGSGGFPDIDGDIVVWEGYQNPGVFVHQLDTGLTRRLTVAGKRPRVSGSRIVYSKSGFGQEDLFIMIWSPM